MAPPKKTLYDILGVSPQANAAEITLAYKARSEALEGAPQADPGARTLLHEAHEILSHPAQRAAYDASLLSAVEKAQAAGQPAPGLALEPESARRPRKVSWVPIGIAAAIALGALLFAMRPRAPAPVAPAPAVAEAPKPPAAPAPPPPKSAVEILADAVTSGGQVMSHEMSGRSTPIGIAMSIEPGTMVTTCHGIPPGGKLVVRVGPDAYPADLVVADEELDLCKLSLANFGTRPLAVSREEPRAGDRIYTVGVNASGEFAMTEGTVRELRPVDRGKLLDLSMPIGASSSGGGVFDTQGRLVGFTTTQHRFGAGANIALPVAWAVEMRSRSAKP